MKTSNRSRSTHQFSRLPQKYLGYNAVRERRELIADIQRDGGFQIAPSTRAQSPRALCQRIRLSWTLRDSSMQCAEHEARTRRENRPPRKNSSNITRCVVSCIVEYLNGQML